MLLFSMTVQLYGVYWLSHGIAKCGESYLVVVLKQNLDIKHQVLGIQVIFYKKKLNKI